MSVVISEAMAKQITGGRRPLVPVEYDQALTALQACQKIDDAKYWSDKADALAAWAKIYHSNEAERQAKMLKLCAYRHMAILAAALRPESWKKRSDGKIAGKKGGSTSLLREHGLSHTKAAAASFIGKMPEAKFEQILARPSPPSPTVVLHQAYSDTEWAKLRPSAMSLRSHCRNSKASVLAKQLNGSEVETARKLIRELIDWLDEFEQHLHK